MKIKDSIFGGLIFALVLVIGALITKTEPSKPQYKIEQDVDLVTNKKGVGESIAMWDNGVMTETETTFTFRSGYSIKTNVHYVSKDKDTLDISLRDMTESKDSITVIQKEHTDYVMSLINYLGK